MTTVVKTTCRQVDYHNLFGRFVHAHMQLAPCPATPSTHAVLAYVPLARSVDLQSSRINDHVAWLHPWTQSEPDVEPSLAPAQRAGVRHWQFDLHQCDDRLEESVCRPKTEVEDSLDHQRTLDRRVRIEAGSTTTGPDRLRARQPCTACSSTQNVRLPRWTSARLYSDPFLTWYR